MALADVRPEAVDLLIRAGTTVTVVLEWPTGALAGRSFSSRLDGDLLALSVVDDTITVVADDVVTGALTAPVEWLLLEDIEGTDEPALVGTWTPSDSPRAVDGATVTVTEGSATVTVNPASAQASVVAVQDQLDAHEALNIGDVHGVRAHDWRLDGTTGLTRLVMTQHGSNAFTVAAQGDVGEWSAATDDGSHREAWRLADTDWADSEMVSLLEGSDTLVAGDLAQWGHLHRLQFDGDLWHAYAVWTDAIFGSPWILNLNVITFDGASALNQGNGGGGGLEDRVGRQLGILRAERASDTVTVHCTGPWLPPVGASVTVAGMGGFDGTFTTTARSTRQRTVTWTQVGADVIDADAGGTITPAAPPRQWMPYRFASRVIGDDPVTIQAKQWRPEEIDEPSWADPERVDTVTVTSASDPAPHGGTGDCALWVGHIEQSNDLRYGPVVARRLS